jgi:hypothetical protein
VEAGVNKLKVRNWSRWQSYRSDRGQPPWIKLHRCIMRDEQWVGMTSAQRGQLIAIWLLAADRDGEVPGDPRLVQKLCFMDEAPDLNWFIENDFLEGDASVTPERRQPDANVTHQIREEESRGEENTPSASPPKFAFKGRVVKLTHDDHEAWQKAFKQLDLDAELVARDEWLAEQPKDVQAKWYASTSKFLANRNMEARAKGAAAIAPAPQKGKQVFNSYKRFEPEAPLVKPPQAEREAQIARLRLLQQKNP